MAKANAFKRFSDYNSKMGLVDSARSFLASDFNKGLVVVLLILGAISYLMSPGEDGVTQESFIHFFFLPTCPHCQEQHHFNDMMEEKYDITIVEHDASKPGGALVFTKVCGQHNLKGQVPTTIVGDKVFVGYDEGIGRQIEEAIKECIKEGCVHDEDHVCTETETFIVALPILGETDLRGYSLPVLAILLGLIDGFNPCAMWVLVYLIAVVMNLKDKSKAWLMVATFVLASGVLYFLFMTAWLNAFLLLGYLKIVTILVGCVALGGGVLHLKEYIEKKGAIECKVGDPDDKKKTMNNLEELLHAPLTLPTVLGIIAIAFVVNSIEFACSAALPAIFTQVLALSNLSTWQYYAYIGLYDIFFMLDDLFIFSFAVLSINALSTNERYVKFSRILGGVLMLIIGIVLLFAPQLLK